MDNSNASPIVADVVQRFYDSLAQQYTGFYADWDAASRSEGEFLRALFRANGVADGASVLDCACGIGTQAIPLAALGYRVAASDLSAGALEEAKRRAAARNVGICFRQADFRALDAVFPERFDAVIAVDNALPHMLTRDLTGKARVFPALRPQDGPGPAGPVSDLGLDGRYLQFHPVHHRRRGDAPGQQIRVRLPGRPQERAHRPAPGERLRRGVLENAGGDGLLPAHRPGEKGMSA